MESLGRGSKSAVSEGAVGRKPCALAEGFAALIGSRRPDMQRFVTGFRDSVAKFADQVFDLIERIKIDLPSD